MLVGSEIKADSISVEDEFMDDIGQETSVLAVKDTIMVDVAKSMTDLMKQNVELKKTLTEYEDKISKLSASRRNIAERAKMQEKKIDALNTKIRGYESNITKLQSRNEVLENRVHDQERVIQSQGQELDVIRPQLQGKEDLVKLLADARVLLGEETSYGYDDAESYYGKVA